MLRRVITGTTLVLLAAGLGALIDAGPGTGDASAAPAAVPDRMCLTCHQAQGLTGAPHGVLRKTMPQQTCEACHGQSPEHIDDPWQNPMQKKASPSERASLCLGCHVSGPEHVTAWADTSFAKEGKTCADCHLVHAASDARLEFEGDGRGYLGEAACRMCHRPVFAGFSESFHGKVIGKPGGGCEACHGPGAAHANGAIELARGEGSAKIAKEPPAENCLTCHAAMPDRHAREMPVYAEKRPACTVCHDVHVNAADPIWSEKGDPGAVAKQKVGSAVCGNCHDTAVKSAKGSVHAALVSDSEKGCEACHGPAGAHVKSGGRSRFIRDPLKMPPDQASDLCLSCHLDSPDHARDFKGGPLAAQGLSCLTCHEAHGDAAAQGRPRMAGQGPAVEGQNVGSRTCAICHENAHPGIERSPHAGLVEDPNAAGCEACHGPGSAHVMRGGAPDAIRNPARDPEERRAGFCLECHGRDTRMFRWARGAHADAGLSCTTCHDPLTALEEGAKKKEPDLCFACHGEVRAAFRLPNHHPIESGAVTCSNCHEVHGEVKGVLSVAARKDRCFTCHRDKQGPFLYEHEADRQDGCTVCHQPHGSVNRRLLTHRRVRDLCLQCHVTPASHTVAAGSPFLNCLNCHGSIHGSYVDKRFFR